MKMKSTKVSFALALALFVAMMMNIGSSIAAESISEPANQADQSAYAKEAGCMRVIIIMRTINPHRGAVATAMLGRLPPCEVKKFIEALE